MDLIMEMDRADIREFFSKNWLTHDAMWYGSCVQELGPDKANQLNKGAVRLMAGVEIKRILKLMGKPKGYKAEDFDDIAEIIDAAFNVVQTRFMKFDFGFPEKNVLRGQFHDCFAYNGVKQFGLVDTYDCGIVERVKGWLDGVGAVYTCTDFTGCLMHRHGSCVIEFQFKFD